MKCYTNLCVLYLSQKPDGDCWKSIHAFEKLVNVLNRDCHTNDSACRLPAVSRAEIQIPLARLTLSASRERANERLREIHDNTSITAYLILYWGKTWLVRQRQRVSTKLCAIYAIVLLQM
jgi:hypothetical protein